VHIPNLHLAASGIAELFDEVSSLDPPDERFGVFSVTKAETVESAEDVQEMSDRHIDEYCEYFRRQLARVEDVEAVLSEIDCE
jgi:hypothetical protein